MPDWGWIVLAVAVVFGASKLPDIARNLGRSSGEFKKGLKEGNEGSGEAEMGTAHAPGAGPPPAAPPPGPSADPEDRGRGTTS
jgi:sec-independent protein translocase protein TatA